MSGRARSPPDAATADLLLDAASGSPKYRDYYMICVTRFCTLKRVRFSHGRVLFDSRTTKSDTSGHCLVTAGRQGRSEIKSIVTTMENHHQDTHETAAPSESAPGRPG